MSEVKTGIYPRGTIDYAAIDAVNFSTLKEFAVSPKHYRHRLTNPKKQTVQMRFGTASHVAILEPDRFGDECVMFTGKQRRGKEWEEFQEANRGKTILTRAEYVEAARLRDAVNEDPVASRYLEYGQPEVAFIWRDEETGVLCKGRVDWLCTDPAHTILDLKSARSIEKWAFGRSAGRLMYHVQACFYSDGYLAITKKDPTFKVLAVESEQPHDAAVYSLTPEVTDIGRDEYRSWLVRLKHHRADDHWPGYANGEELEFMLPAWMMGEDDDMSGLDLE